MAVDKASYYLPPVCYCPGSLRGTCPRAWLLVCFFVPIIPPLIGDNQDADLQTVRKVTLFIQLVNCV